MDTQHRQTTMMELEAAMKSNHDQPESKSQTSSPSHEFSFTITSSTFPPIASSFAIDLSPADDIFFHGHLLPLHLLSHLPVPPRSSADSFTLPNTESLDQHDYIPDETNPKNTDPTDINTNRNEKKDKTKPKPKPSCLLSLKKGHDYEDKDEEEEEEEEEDDDIEKPKRRLKLNVISQVLKRYAKMVRPLLSFKEKRKKLHSERSQGYSFSENYIRVKKKEETGRRRREYLSAPASMGGSPSNSGPLTPEGHLIHLKTPPPSPPHVSDSTMEELQAAIQAAIAHCKNSINSSDNIAN